jgi:hypothetical protein
VTALLINTEKNIRLFAQFGGLQILVKLMRMYQNYHEVLYPCVGLVTMVACNDGRGTFFYPQ